MIYKMNSFNNNLLSLNGIPGMQRLKHSFQFTWTDGDQLLSDEDAAEQLQGCSSLHRVAGPQVVAWTGVTHSA